MKVNKRKQLETWEVGKVQTLFSANLIIYLKDTRGSVLKLTKLIKSFNKVVEYEIQTKINSLFIYKQ